LSRDIFACKGTHHILSGAKLYKIKEINCVEAAKYIEQQDVEILQICVRVHARWTLAYHWGILDT
jgi:hypothetical protein